MTYAMERFPKGGGVKITPVFFWKCSIGHSLGTLATDAAGQLDVLGHDGHTLGVDCSQVGVLKQAHQVCLGSLLQSQDGAALEAQVSLEVLGNLTHEALERQLADQQLRALLVLADLTQGHGTGAVPEGEQEETKRCCNYPTTGWFNLCRGFVLKKDVGTVTK